MEESSDNFRPSEFHNFITETDFFEDSSCFSWKASSMCILSSNPSLRHKNNSETFCLEQAVYSPYSQVRFKNIVFYSRYSKSFPPKLPAAFLPFSCQSTFWAEFFLYFKFSAFGSLEWKPACRKLPNISHVWIFIRYKFTFFQLYRL